MNQKMTLNVNIAVAFRNSADGRDALRLGIRLGRLLAARLDIITILPADATEGRVEQDREHLEAARAECMQNGLTAEIHLMRGHSVAQSLMDVAHRAQARLLVLGTARGSLFGRFAVGSVSGVLLHSADIALALAPDSFREQDVTRLFSRISVAVGDLGGNRNMLAMAQLLARGGTIPVRLLSVIAAGESDAEQLRNEAEGRLDTMALDALPSSIRSSTHVEVSGRIDRAVEQVYWSPEEIVLIGSSRIAAARRAFLGSTATKIVRSLSVPMIIVPRDEQTTSLEAEAQ